MAKLPPRWQAHCASNYDSEMTARCTVLLSEIIADPNRRQGILTDPQHLHRDLFAPFAPPDHADFGGTYRGTPGTALVDRRGHVPGRGIPGRAGSGLTPGYAGLQA